MIAGGGTGGHLYPGIAIYRALEALDGGVEVLFIGAKRGVESGIFNRLGLPHLLLSGWGVRGKSVLSKLAAPFVLKWSVFQAIKAILAFKPDIVVGTGGYASVSAVIASVVCGKIRVLQEQNSVPGLANRLLSRFASLVLLSYEESQVYFPSRVPSVVVGNPLRIDPAKTRTGSARREALEFFGFEEDLPVILIFGGSRGAQSINRAGSEAAKLIVEENKAQILFITGERDFEWIGRDLESYTPRVKVLPFLEEIQNAYAVADLAVARAGASSVFELAAFGIPTVFVPYPYAADDHQRRNAEPLVSLGAAVVIDDSKLSGGTLAGLTRMLLDDKAKRSVMSERMRSWVKTDSADRAAEIITDLVKKNACNRLRGRVVGFLKTSSGTGRH